MPKRITNSHCFIAALLALACAGIALAQPAPRVRDACDNLQASGVKAPRDVRDPRDDVFYHFMPIAWRDSDNDTYRFGDFGGMTASLDYLEYLGVTAVWMNPIFPSVAYHGYQHGPADTLNSWFGSEADFINFVEQAHARGIKVFVDYVAYGVSQDNVWFNDAYSNPGSPYDDWFAFTNASNTSYLGSTFTTWNGDTVRFIHWDLRNTTVSGMVTAWAQYWLDPNGDGELYRRHRRLSPRSRLGAVQLRPRRLGLQHR